MSNPSPPSSTSGESAVSAPAPTAKKQLEQPATWPGNVPSQAVALEVLRGRQTLAVSLPGAHRLQEKLTHPEREALQTDGVADALREAVAVRWRLAAALDLLLTAQGRVDQAALDALMAEVDAALGALRTMNAASPEWALAIDRTLETLTQEAVDFDSNVKAASAPTAVSPTPAPKKAAAHATGKVTFQQEEPEQAPPRHKKAVYLALAVVVVAAGGYHISNLLRSAEQAKSNYPGAPNNTLVIPSASSGALTVRSTLAGPATAEQQAWLEQQKAQGMQVKEVSPGTWLVTPAPKAPATADTTTP